MKGFPFKRNDWIMKVVSSGKLNVKVSGEVGAYFCSYQGLGQGDPLPPLPFDLAV